MQKIIPFLWFDNQAEQAVNFYASVFDDTRVIGMNRYGDGAPFPKGTVMSATFELAGQRFMALNGGPHHKFTPAISLFVKCETQQEVDYYWEKLSEDGEEQPCGWVTDKFGLSWQIIPNVLGELLNGEDAGKAGRVMQAMLQMRKIDIAALQAANAG